VCSRHVRNPRIGDRFRGFYSEGDGVLLTFLSLHLFKSNSGFNLAFSSLDSLLSKCLDLLKLCTMQIAYFLRPVLRASFDQV
jgi:hypothetical protein